MRTISQVAELSGVSIRTLQYYDEIGLLKPSELTQSGYRLYNADALQKLQQILFFKELGISARHFGRYKDIILLERCSIVVVFQKGMYEYQSHSTCWL